jgi:hypothetical protein
MDLFTTTSVENTNLLPHDGTVIYMDNARKG